MPSRQSKGVAATDATLTAFACPNEDCSDFNRFGAGNLSVCEWIGKDKQIRRLYCGTCGHRFSERQGTLLQYSKSPEETIVRIVRCLVHGCSMEATADICEVTPRTVGCFLKKAGVVPKTSTDCSWTRSSPKKTRSNINDDNTSSSPGGDGPNEPAAPARPQHSAFAMKTRNAGPRSGWPRR